MSEDELAASIRLETTDGSGIVYPHGFYGPGYFLPEWAFIRYRARVDHEEPIQEQKSWWQRHMMELSFPGALLWIAALQAADALSEVHVSFSFLPAAIAIFLLFPFYRAALRNLHSEPQELLESFPGARRLSYFAYWGPRTTQAMTRWKAKLCFRLFCLILFSAFLLYVLYPVMTDGKLSLVYAAIFIPPILVLTCASILVLPSILWVCLKQRRWPRPSDVPAVDPPARAA